MNLSTWLVLAFLVVPRSGFASSNLNQAEDNIKRLSASEFPELPSVLKSKIEGKGCKIPQAFTSMHLTT